MARKKKEEEIKISPEAEGAAAERLAIHIKQQALSKVKRNVIITYQGTTLTLRYGKMTFSSIGAAKQALRSYFSYSKQTNDLVEARVKEAKDNNPKISYADTRAIRMRTEEEVFQAMYKLVEFDKIL